MQQRVACRRCGAHKDEAVWAGHCLVCGGLSFKPVPPTPGDQTPAVEAYAVPRSKDA